MIKAVVFDLDGVIVSTDEYHYKAWKAIADECGIYFDRTINNRLRGVSRRASLEVILEKADRVYSEAEKDALTDRKNEIYKKLLEGLTPEERDPGFDALYAFLKKEGIRTAIGSGSRNTMNILTKIGLADCFDAVADGTMITKSKPDPEVFLKAAELLGEAPEHCLVVEDAAAGVQAGKAAGMMTAGIQDAASSSYSDFPLNTLQDVIQVIQSVNRER